jgi:hypothetical protein
VVIQSLTVDDNINITDNEITTTQSDSDLVLTPAGTGSVVISSDLDINGGTIDNTVIGGTTPAAGTFTTLTANTSVTIDGVTITTTPYPPAGPTMTWNSRAVDRAPSP